MSVDYRKERAELDRLLKLEKEVRWQILGMTRTASRYPWSSRLHDELEWLAAETYPNDTPTQRHERCNRWKRLVRRDLGISGKAITRSEFKAALSYIKESVWEESKEEKVNET